MSYDLCLFPPPPGQDLLRAGRAACGEAEGDGTPTPGPPLGAREAIRSMAAAIAAAEPTLTAESHGAGTADAFVELDAPEEGSGLQVLVFATTVFIHLPYWHRGDEARAAWEQALRCARAVEKEAGFRTYDPQQDRVLDLEADLDSVLAEYAAGLEATDRLIASMPRPEAAAPPPRPWWKFWG